MAKSDTGDQVLTHGLQTSIESESFESHKIRQRESSVDTCGYLPDQDNLHRRGRRRRKYGSWQNPFQEMGNAEHLNRVNFQKKVRSEMRRFSRISANASVVQRMTSVVISRRVSHTFQVNAKRSQSLPNIAYHEQDSWPTIEHLVKATFRINRSLYQHLGVTSSSDAVVVDMGQTGSPPRRPLRPVVPHPSEEVKGQRRRNGVARPDHVIPTDASMDDLLLRRSGMRKLKHKTKSIDIPNLHQRRGAFCEKYRHLSAGDSPVSSDALDEAMDSSPPNKEADDEVSLFNEQVTEVFPTSAFDIVGPRKNSRYPWQRDVGVQCNLLRERLSSSDCSASRLSDSSDQYSVKVSSVDSGTGIDSNRTAAKAYLRQTIDLFDDHRGPRVRAIKDEWFTKRRSAALTEPDLDYLQHIPTMIRPKPKLSRMHSADSMMTKEWKSFNGGTCGRRAISVVQDPDTYRCSGCLSGRDSFSSTMPLLDDRDSLKSIPSMDIIGRADTLQSPRVSPVPWLEQGIPSLVVTDTKSTEAKDLERTQSVQSSDSEERYLQVPPRVSLRRNSSGSIQSASDESDTEPSPPMPRRGRRQAIIDPKSLAEDGELSPTNSCDESEACNSTSSGAGGGGGGEARPVPLRRKRSSADLGMNYPGDLLVQNPRMIRGKPPLIKRNTIADFANTKAYQASTASIISAVENDSKKIKGSFSLLKLIDKKTHRSKSDLGEVLLNIKPSSFKDSHVTYYKDAHWSDLIASNDKDKGQPIEGLPESERKRREAVWELFTSECVFLVDHLMVLKHCFMENLKKVQVEGHLMFAEPQDLFGNLDELCYVSHTFCSNFISLLLKDAQATDFGRTEILIKALHGFSKLTRDGEVYHDYCLNYPKAVTYLDQLRKNDDFCQFEKWCEQDPRCHRLQITDLLVSPMQHCTKVPLLLNNIRRYTSDNDECNQLTESLEKLETSLKNLEAKMRWLKNFERVQEIQQQIIWQPITELEPRAFIPEFLKSSLNKQPCERLLASPKRQLLHEGSVTLLEISKTVDMYMFLFDDILLLTRIKKPPRKKQSVVDPSVGTSIPSAQTEGAVFVVYRQPMALDRLTVHDIRPPDATANGLRNAFVLVQISRFQQIIGVCTLQAPSENAKSVWLSRLHEAQEKYKEASSNNSSENQDRNNNMNFLEEADDHAIPPPRRAMSLKKLRSPKGRSKRASTVSAQEGRSDLGVSDLLGFPLERKAISLSNNAIQLDDKNSDDGDDIPSDQDRRVSDPATPTMTHTNSVGCMADQPRKFSQPETDSIAPATSFSTFNPQLESEFEELQVHAMANRGAERSPSRTKRPTPLLGAIDEKSQQSIDALYI